MSEIKTEDSKEDYTFYTIELSSNVNKEDCKKEKPKKKSKKPIVIVEGPIDSMFLDNAIAMAGADVSRDSVVQGDIVYVYDNEPRNPQITKRIEKHIDVGDSVVIWPIDITQKDINDMVMAGIKVKEVVIT